MLRIPCCSRSPHTCVWRLGTDFYVLGFRADSNVCVTIGMPLTHDFKETIRARAQSDADFRKALLREAVECIVNGDLETGKAVLRDYVNATVGFQNLEKHTHIPVKSLMRMLGPKGSPSAANLSNILTVLQKTEGVHFELSLKR